MELGNHFHFRTANISDDIWSILTGEQHCRNTPRGPGGWQVGYESAMPWQMRRTAWVVAGTVSPITQAR